MPLFILVCATIVSLFTAGQQLCTAFSEFMQLLSACLKIRHLRVIGWKNVWGL